MFRKGEKNAELLGVGQTEREKRAFAGKIPKVGRKDLRKHRRSGQKESFDWKGEGGGGNPGAVKI